MPGGDFFAPLPFSRPGADPAANPTAAAVILGVLLRQLRDRSGLTLTQAGKKVACSNSKLSRLERAENLAARKDVSDLAALYEATPEETAGLLELVEYAHRPGWWNRYVDAAPGWLEQLIGLETAAVELWAYEAMVVPGLLQTEAYAWDVISRHALRTESEAVQRAVGLRLERQRRFFGSPPRLAHFLINEFALQPMVEDRAVMAEQMEHLLKMSRTPGVKVRVLPMSRTIASPLGGLTHLKFNPGGPPQMVYLEGYEKADYFVEGPGTGGSRSSTSDLERHLQLLVRLEKRAASRRKSLALLRQALARYSGPNQ